jgi:hypothetical protein
LGALGFFANKEHLVAIGVGGFRPTGLAGGGHVPTSPRERAPLLQIGTMPRPCHENSERLLRRMRNTDVT